jgi:hypothetical protein
MTRLINERGAAPGRALGRRIPAGAAPVVPSRGRYTPGQTSYAAFLVAAIPQGLVGDSGILWLGSL